MTLKSCQRKARMDRANASNIADAANLHASQASQPKRNKNVAFISPGQKRHNTSDEEYQRYCNLCNAEGRPEYSENSTNRFLAARAIVYDLILPETGTGTLSSEAPPVWQQFNIQSLKSNQWGSNAGFLLPWLVQLFYPVIVLLLNF